MSGAGDGGLPLLLGNQAQASGPDAHVWLSASAGTGKTQVLAARVYRLLLRGTDPGAILCLTFTKAGAAEMAGRINARLAAWVRMPLNDLRQDLHALGEDAHDPALVERARTLFARVLDASGGGIRIQTIHSFCQSLLASFPAEAGLIPGFRPLEAREESLLAREALAEMLEDAEREGRSHLLDAVASLSMRLGEGGAEEFLKACAKRPDAMATLKGDIGPYLRQLLDLPVGDVESVIAAGCSDAAFDTDPLRAIAAANRGWGTKTGLAAADTAAEWLKASPAGRAAMLEAMLQIVLTKDGKPRSVGDKLLALEPDYPIFAQLLADQGNALLDLRRLAAFCDVLAPALAAGRDYAAVYQRAKRRLGAVDFDDLIRATVALLAQDGMGAWVRYKLDQVTEHILVDEAQDTNQAQWEIIRLLTEEFFAGLGAHGERTRTLFVVGDFKQAIFGFQGTSPLHFARAERDFHTLAADARDDRTGQGTPFHRLSLTHSFRSTRPILEFVDAAIAAIPDPGLGPIDVSEAHASEVKGPGTVTLWPTIVVGGSEEDEESRIEDATRELARKIARQIRDWLDPASPLMLDSKGRPLVAQDVMVLVKRRSELAALIVARLYAEGVPVAGIDRLRLNAPLAVQDLLAAVRFVLQPDDDLSLASLLVSPLLGWTQDELMHAAVKRGRSSLWRHLRTQQSAERLAPLQAMLARADLTTPYQFLEELLSGPLDARRKLLHRLGEEARDPIDELLGAALQFETLATPGLQAFLDWFDRGDVEIKRDPSQPSGAVRVMTAHGAKGLQAPLVILADATVDPDRSPRSTLSWSPAREGPALPILRPRKEELAGPFVSLAAEADARELEEHWRLFYVAATRAEERLIIAGALGPRARGEPPKHSWYAAAVRAFDALGVAASEMGDRVFVGTSPQPPVKPSKSNQALPAPAAALPDWVRQPAPQEASPPRPLTPSSLGPDDVADPPPTSAMRAAAERGRLVHRLFERLPGLAAADRRSIAERWLMTAEGVADQALRADIIDSVLRVTDDPRFADMFGPGTLAEAPITAVIAGGRVVSGTVDRLLVTADRVRIVDFKTGRRAPASLDEVPLAHLNQMAAYHAALGVIFPDRQIEAALLYTAAPVLFDLPAVLLDAHKQRFAMAEQSYGDRA
jgi:ATP-dependent helicase/nuclease subunit A